MNLQYPYSAVTSQENRANAYFLLSLQAAGEISTLLASRYKEKLPSFEVTPCGFFSFGADYTEGFQMKCHSAHSSMYIIVLEVGHRLDLSVGSIFYEVVCLALYERMDCGERLAAPRIHSKDSTYIDDNDPYDGPSTSYPAMTEEEIVEALDSLQEQATSLLIARMKEEVAKDPDEYDPFAEE